MTNSFLAGVKIRDKTDLENDGNAKDRPITSK